jgi:hypothetical protein
MGQTTTIAVGRIGYDWSVKRDDILVERYRSIALAMLAARELAASLRQSGAVVKMRMGDGQLGLPGADVR